jgi:hypothetical protein
MAGISAYMEKAMLDWTLGGAPVKPAAWSIGLSAGVPSSISGSEIAVATAVRQTVAFAAAASPAGSASNSLAATFAFNSAATISGLQVWDTAATTLGNMLYFGTLATARVLNAGDSLVFSVGALVITLA